MIMSEFDLNKLVRNNIRELIPYSSARDEFSGEASILLDANENPFNTPFNRYPDPLQKKLKQKISRIFDVQINQIFLGNGSDEAIDLLIRAFCIPGTNNILITDPSYGMYEVCAGINDIEVRKVLLNDDYSLNPGNLINSADENSSIVFLCSPNNPTSNLLNEEDIIKVLSEFKGIVVIDEAYIDFSGSNGFLERINEFRNLIVLRTFSKAWGLAGIRLGIAFAGENIIAILNKIKYPYNINNLSQKVALKYLKNKSAIKNWVKAIQKERKIMARQLIALKVVQNVYHSDANFFLIKIMNAKDLYIFLKDQKIIVRDRSNVSLCNDCLRITIGTKKENRKLIKAIKQYKCPEDKSKVHNEL